MQPGMLLIEDEPLLAELVQAVAEDIGFQVTVCATFDSVSQSLSGTRPDTVIMDLNLPGVETDAILRLFSDAGLSARIIVVSGSDINRIDKVFRKGQEIGLQMHATLSKPFDIQDLETMIAELHEPSEEQRRNGLNLASGQYC